MSEEENKNINEKTKPFPRYSGGMTDKQVKYQMRQLGIAADIYPDIPEEVIFGEGAARIHPNLSNDPKDRLVQRQYWGWFGILIADRLKIANKTRLIRTFLIAMLVSIPLGAIGLISSFDWLPETIVVGFVSFLLISYWRGWDPKLTKWLLPVQENIFFGQDVKSAEDHIKRTMVRDFDTETTPPDLQDTKRGLVYDIDGLSLAGQIMPKDIEFPTFSYVLHKMGKAHISMFANTLAVFVLLFDMVGMALGQTNFSALGAIDLVMTGIIGGAIFLTLPNLLFELYANYIDDTPLVNRLEEGSQAQAQNATIELIDYVGVNHGKNIEEARNIQIENASRDTGKFFEIGTSTGILFERRDPFAPNADLPFGFTLEDMVHCIVLGGSGSGKTSSVARPIARQILNSPNSDYGRKNGIGMLVLDAKGALPAELCDLSDDYTLINPETANFNPIQYLDPDQVADGFAEMFSSSETEDIWSQSATKLIRACAVMLEMSNKPWTLSELYRFVSDDDYIHDDVLAGEEMQTPKSEMMPYQRSAVTYRTVDFMRMPEKAKGSVLFTAQIWLSAIVDNRELSAWGATEEGLRVEDVTKGLKIGLNLPESKYGKAGQLVTIFTKKRVYNAVKNRGDTWKNDPEQTAVLLLADEAQGLITSDESALLPIGRSLGIHVMFLTQNIDGLVNALGSIEEANQLLGNLITMIALKSETEMSRNFISSRMGSEWRCITEKSHSIADTRSEYNALENNSADVLVNNTQWGSHPLFGSSAGMTRTVMERIRRVLSGESTKELESKISCASIVKADEISGMLCIPNTALVSGNRGRVPRRDVVKLKPIYT
jgi:hypothetical protein